MTDKLQNIELDIISIGAMGDGLAKHGGRDVFVPLTCVGDKVKVSVYQETQDYIKASLVEVVSPSKQRQKPLCVHFGECGGCSLQHLNKQAYNDFKNGILADVISDLGVDASLISPMVDVGAHSRRRVEFKVSVKKGKVELGFFAAKSHDLINLAECPVSDNELVKILPSLRKMLEGLKKPGVIKAISLTKLDAGFDAVIITRKKISLSDKSELIDFAKNTEMVRLSEYLQVSELSHNSATEASSECFYDSGNAKVTFADVAVELPVGAFLQATYKGQSAITEFVERHLKGYGRIADLYSGCGTYSFPLVRQSKSVAAYEGAEEMALAMHNAILKNELSAKMTASTRDLFKRPLKEYELNRFDGLVINPPRNGALPQVKNISKSDVNKVVMVSCNPITFKRDAKCLIDGGYKILEVVAIDQFFWSSHLEVVACFSK